VCCNQDEPDFLKVVAGKKDLSAAGGQEAFVESVIEHEDFDK